MDFLLYLLRVSSSNPGSKISATQSSNDAISLFSDLLRQIAAMGMLIHRNSLLFTRKP